MTRLTKAPLDACPIWGFDAISWDVVIKWGLIGVASVTVYTVALTVVVCMWFMPKAKEAR